MKAGFYKQKTLAVLNYLIDKGGVPSAILHALSDVGKIVCREGDGFVDLEDKALIIKALLEKLQQPVNYKQLSQWQQIWLHLLINDSFEGKMKVFSSGRGVITSLMRREMHEVASFEHQSTINCEFNKAIPNKEQMFAHAQRFFWAANTYATSPYARTSAPISTQLEQLPTTEHMSFDDTDDIENGYILLEDNEALGICELDSSMGFYLKINTGDKTEYIVGKISNEYSKFILETHNELKSKFGDTFTHEFVLIGGSIDSLPEIVELLTMARNQALNISHISVIKDINAEEGEVTISIRKENPDTIYFSEPQAPDLTPQHAVVADDSFTTPRRAPTPN